MVVPAKSLLWSLLSSSGGSCHVTVMVPTTNNLAVAVNLMFSSQRHVIFPKLLCLVIKLGVTYIGIKTPVPITIPELELMFCF